MTKSIVGLALALACAGSSINPASADMYEKSCTGNACEKLSVVWIKDGFKFYNEGSKPLRLELRSGEPGNCGELKISDIAPGDTVIYGEESFCGPVKANFRPGGAR